MTQIKYPFGLSDSKTLSATGAQAITIDDDLTIIDGVTTQATGNRTINLTVDAEVEAGAKILLKTKSNGTETTIFGTKISSITVTGAAGKTFSQSFTYDGSNFLPDGTAVKID